MFNVAAVRLGAESGRRDLIGDLEQCPTGIPEVFIQISGTV